ncbi:MAG: SUMF1/EgtB/PvdO family nonheme iron enzyme [Candidatus Eisenbacteria bacterium]
MLTKRTNVAACCICLLMLVVLSCGRDKPTDSGGNTAPTASFTITPAIGDMLTSFQFDASGSSDAQDPVSALQVRWDWENDGTWDTQWSATKTASHQYGTLGTKTIKLEVEDTGGLTDDTSRTVTVTQRLTPPEMVLVPAGTFTMGDGVAYCGVAKHQVTLNRSFYLGKYEVTNKEYRDALQWAYDQNPKMVTVEGSAPGTKYVYAILDGHSSVLLATLFPSECEVYFGGDAFTVNPGKENYPMVCVSWRGAAAYCDWLSMSQGLAPAYNHSTWQCNSGDPYGASGYRLPTDAEWEYATQYGGERIYPWGNESPNCSRANYRDCGLHLPIAVGSCPAGATSLGLHDMAGNVYEWCNDWHTCNLGTSSVVDPKGPSSGSYHVMRGGAYNFFNDDLRCAYRHFDTGTPGYGGFRCARSQ